MRGLNRFSVVLFSRRRLVEASVEGAYTSGVAIARQARGVKRLRSCWRGGGRVTAARACRCSLNVLTQPNMRDICLNRFFFVWEGDEMGAYITTCGLLEFLVFFGAKNGPHVVFAAKTKTRTG